MNNLENLVKTISNKILHKDIDRNIKCYGENMFCAYQDFSATVPLLIVDLIDSEEIDLWDFLDVLVCELIYNSMRDLVKYE